MAQSFAPRIDLITVLTDSFDEMLEFYRDVVGFPVNRELDHYAEFESPGVRFALCARSIMKSATGHESFAEGRCGQAFELAFPVDSPEHVDQVYRTLTLRGATGVRPPTDMPWGQRTAFFADPEGNIHEVFADAITHAHTEGIS